MTNKLRALVTFGTRPDAIKMAPVVRLCRQRSADIETIVCTTGQHREMLEPVMSYFGLAADRHLDLMRPDQALADLHARCLAGIDAALADYQPDCVVAQGDTTTLLATALAAFYRRVPLVHLEAGLRTGDLAAPWPEELNRRVATLAAALHCAPTRQAAQNLLAEGVPAERVHVTGNTVIDALFWTVDRERAAGAPWSQKYAFLGRRPMVLITGHRRENLGAGLARVCSAVAALAERFAGVEFVYPVHLNPRVEQTVRGMLSGRQNVHLGPPAPYPEFVWLMDRSTLILTDSGGVQEEAPSLGKPVLVTRDATERPEGLAAGAVTLVGTDAGRIVAEATRLLAQEHPLAVPPQPFESPYGDGRAAARIVDLLVAQAWARPARPA